jgi:uncharacterized protein YecT (DUF1311 family)
MYVTAHRWYGGAMEIFKGLSLSGVKYENCFHRMYNTRTNFLQEMLQQKY